MTVGTCTVRVETTRTADAKRLLAEAAAELMRRYGRCHPLPLEEAEQERAAFLVARWGEEGTAVGCAVLRPFAEAPDTTAEVKRMFVDAAVRGRGIGAALMHALETEARRLGYRHIVLETGTKQPEAMRLYERHAYDRIACWGEYATNPLSVCYCKPVAQGSEGG